MLKDRVLFTGSSSVSHPVLDKLFGGPLDPSEEKVRVAGDHVLVVIDARLGASDLAEDGAARTALDKGIPVLVIAPNEGQLESLTPVIGAVPNTPAQAVLIAPNANRKEASRYEVTWLGYAANLVDTEQAKQVNDNKGKDQPKKDGCGCRERSAAESHDSAVTDFATKVESRTTKAYNPAPLAFPDGLRYFQTTWNWTTYFTSSGCNDDDDCFTNGQGSLGVSYVVWGFLSQTASQNSQYLVIEGTYSLYPGSLDGNDDETRGFLNLNCQSNVGPTAGGFSLTNHIPTNGTDSWNDSFTLDISYKDPIGGGYQIYEYTATVNQSIGSWSVQNASAAPKAGSLWYVNSPMNGSNINDTWKDAFSGAGHVETFPSASTGTLSAKEASAWQTYSIQSGNVTVSVGLTWKETVFFGTSCGLLICYVIQYISENWSSNPSFSVNFSSITPS